MIFSCKNSKSTCDARRAARHFVHVVRSRSFSHLALPLQLAPPGARLRLALAGLLVPPLVLRAARATALPLSLVASIGRCRPPALDELAVERFALAVGVLRKSHNM